jgi:nucleoside-diphosphate-sugar epimerase
MTQTLSVAVLGANGVYGRHLIPRLAAAGHRVVALARRPAEARVAVACGAEVRAADIFQPEQLATALRGCDIGVNLATSLPGPSGRGDYAANDRLRRDGTPLWIAACREAGVPRVLQQGIAMIHGGHGDEWVDEQTPPQPDDSVAGAAIGASLAMEASVRESGLDWTIVRGGLFYGPGTGFDDEWYDRARAGRLRLPGDGSSYVSLVHIEDMAAATVAAIDRWPSGQALNVCDDRPAPWRDVLAFVSQCAGAEPPATGGRLGFPSFRVRNRRARDTLGWAPFYPSFHSGLIR